MALTPVKQQYFSYNGVAVTVITFQYAMGNGASGTGRTVHFFLGGAQPDSVTYNGVPLAVVDSDASPFCRLYIAEDVGLPADTLDHDLVFTYPAARTGQGVFVSEDSGAKQLGATPPGVCTSDTSAATHPVTITTTVDGVAVKLFYLRVEDRTMDSQPAGTVLLTDDAGTLFDGQRIILATGPTPAGPVTFTFDSSGNSNYRAAAVQVEEEPTASDVEASGALALPMLTLAGDAGVTVGADAGLSLPMLTLSGDAAVAVLGSGALTLPSLVLAAQGDVAVSAAVSLVLPMLALSGLAQGPAVTGSGGLTLPMPTLASAGAVAAAARKFITGKVRMRPVVTGGVRTLPVVTGKVRMLPVITAKVKSPAGPGTPAGPRTSASLTLPMLTLSGAAEIPTGIGGQLVLPMLTLVGEVEVPIEADGGLTLPMLTLSGAGTVANPPTNLLHTFTGADDPSTVGVADSGHTPIVLAGTWGRIGGKAYCPTGVGNDAVVFDCGAADGIAAVVFTTVSHTGARLVARATDANNYLILIAAGSLFRRVAGSNIFIGSGPAFIAGDRAEIELSGSSVIVRKNGAQIISVTETFNQTATRHGVGNGSATASANRWDDLEFTPA